MIPLRSGSACSNSLRTGGTIEFLLLLQLTWIKSHTERQELDALLFVSHSFTQFKHFIASYLLQGMSDWDTVRNWQKGRTAGKHTHTHTEACTRTGAVSYREFVGSCLIWENRNLAGTRGFNFAPGSSMNHEEQVGPGLIHIYFAVSRKSFQPCLAVGLLRVEDWTPTVFSQS